MLWVCMAEQQGINGTIFYAKVTQLCWQYVLDSWVACNHALHDSTQLYDISQLRTTVQQIFHKAAQHPNTQATICDQTIYTILAQPIRSIVSWAQCSAMHICNHATTTATQTRLNNTSIWSFFQVHPRPQPQPLPPQLQRHDLSAMTFKATYFNACPTPSIALADKSLLCPP